ncbi:hypothetical protein SIPHO054v2_p0046 [Vibrio phage 103E44.1]|nr:hypothetical protein SIPHO054v2_p0046 [Vibrio phage 103E44.1]QZI87900.1 hypothetical protein SIPHO055v2_p0045 [Vibrio phage 104E43.1]
MNKLTTCGNCPHVKLNNLGRMGVIAYCGNTDDELIVPHQFDGDKITFTRVPEFCTNENATPSVRPAPTKQWIIVPTGEHH